MKPLFTFLVLLLLAPLRAGAQPAPVVLNEGFGSIPLGLHLEYLEETNGPWSAEEVLSPEIASQFQTNATPVFSIGVFHGPHWFRFTVRNPSPEDQPVIFQIDHEFWTLELYTTVPGEGPQLAASMSLDQLSTVASREALLETRLVIPAEQQVDYLMRLETRFDMKAMVSLWEPDARREQNLFEHAFYSWCWGGLAVFILIYLTVYLRLRDVVYLDYALFLALFLFFRIHVHVWVDLMPFRSNGIHWLGLLLIYASSYSGFRFTSGLLALEKHFPRARRAAHRLLLLVLLIAVTLAGLTQSIMVVFVLLSLTTSALIFFIIWAMLQSYVIYKEVVLYSLVGWFMLVLAALSLPLMSLGVLPWNPSIGLWIEAVALLDAAAFSVALANRFHLMQLERDQANEDAQAERRRADKELIRSLREKEQFRSTLLANASHELKTPLQGMLGLTEEVLEKLHKRGLAHVEHSLSLALYSGKRLQRLIENLLDLAAIQEHRLQIHRETVFVHTLVEEALSLTQVQFSSKPVEYANQVASELPPVWADSGRLLQVLLNLLFNAGKFTEQGRIEVRGKVLGERVRIEVHDSGPGVALEHRESIFERFHQNSPQQTEGLGLGLSISSEIMQEQGGRIGVEDSPLEGALFWIELPLSSQGETAPPAPLASEAPDIKPQELVLTPPEPSSTSGKQILIVDDDVVNLYTMMRQLEDLTVSVSCFNKGAEVLEYLQQGHLPELIILDVMMPELDGFEVCEILRERFSKEALPILFLTALSRPEDMARAFEVGGNDYLSKPVQRAELWARVAAHLELSRLRKASTQNVPSRSSDRELLVKVLQLTLEVWRELTGKGPVEFAQESKLWGAYLEKQTGQWRTRNLSQYLSPSTLPPNPRWRKVAQSGEFVLSRTPQDHPRHPELSEMLAELYSTYQSRS